MGSREDGMRGGSRKEKVCRATPLSYIRVSILSAFLPKMSIRLWMVLVAVYWLLPTYWDARSQFLAAEASRLLAEVLPGVAPQRNWTGSRTRLQWGNPGKSAAIPS